MTDITYEQQSFDVDDVRVEISAVRRAGAHPPIVFLHGFGSTKEDDVDLAYHAGFRGRPFLAYDTPGCGESSRLLGSDEYGTPRYRDCCSYVKKLMVMAVFLGSGGARWSRCQMRRARWRLRQRMASRWVLPSAVLRAM